MNRKMPQITIIVPVYNSEQYLHRCIDSILAQTFTDFELLLIDDGSKDNSGAICDEYAQKDNRVRVFHKENGGVSSARNFGLDNAQGEWITFVDSDDWMERSMLYNLIGIDDADLIVGAMKFEHDNTIGVFPKIGKLNGSTFNSLLAENIDHHSISGPCSKLFKRNIVNENRLRFNELLTFGEDAVFVKQYLGKVLSIRVTDALCYHYNDIGDDIYKKYAKSFYPILQYYIEMSALYERIENNKGISISRHGIVGVVFNIAHVCLIKNGKRDIDNVLTFMRDKSVREELRKRKSFNINLQLVLALLPKGYLLLYYLKLISLIK